MQDYVRKITKYLGERLGKNNVVVRYNSQVEGFEIVIKNKYGIVSMFYDRENIEYEFEDTMQDILDGFILR